MKRKDKVITILGISVLMCSLVLVAIPITAIAAEQDDYVLGVYGNANEDDTIDMRDLTYVKLIFFGKKPETELADAKYNGKINPLDFIQIKLIIVGKEKELTVENIFGEAVTIHKPVKRVIVSYRDMVEVMRALNAENKIVGIAEHIQAEKVYFPDISRLPTFGSFWMPDFEAVLSLNTEVFLTFGDAMTLENKEVFKEKLPSVTIVSLIVSHPETFTENVRKLGYILDRNEEVEEFMDWYEGHINSIKDRTEAFSEDKKSRVYYETAQSYKPGWGGSRFDQMIVTAGGRNIAADLTGMGKVDPEWVLKQNPDIIVKHASLSYGFSTGYDTDDPSGLITMRDEIMNRPELANVKAVKNGRVYVIDSHHTAGPGCLIGTAYMAKWFHPDLFEDLDPRVIHQEYLDRFQHFDFNVYEHGVFVYPPLED